MKKVNKTGSNLLRQKAEKLAKGKEGQPDKNPLESDMLKLIHELDVHQIELELQNEELMLSQSDLKSANEKYAELYTEIYDFTPSGYFTLTSEGKILKLNLKGASLLGKERSYLVNSSFAFFVTTDTRPLFNRFLKKVFSNHLPESCEVELSSGKSNPPIFVYLTGIVNKSEDECLMTATDITERKKAELARKESEERYRLVLENSLDAILLMAPDGSIQAANPAACSMFQRTEEEICTLGRDGLIDLEDPRLYEFLEERKKTGKVKSELNMVRKDGTRVPVQITSSVYTDARGEERTSMIIRDITDLKQTEQILQNKNRLLQQLYVHQDQIRENDRKRISREIHDELGQSLSALKIDLGWLKDHLELNQRAFDKINGMSDIVSETIKTVQRIASDLRPGLLDDLGLIPAMEWYCQEFEKRTGVICQFIGDDIEINNERITLVIYRILQEALTNVMRHSEANNVMVNLYKKNEWIVLEVNDNGKGMDSSKINGPTSLGIVGMRERVNQYNGKLNISSKLNKGTKLSIHIPLT